MRKLKKCRIIFNEDCPIPSNMASEADYEATHLDFERVKHYPPDTVRIYNGNDLVAIHDVRNIFSIQLLELSKEKANKTISNFKSRKYFIDEISETIKITLFGDWPETILLRQPHSPAIHYAKYQLLQTIDSPTTTHNTDYDLKAQEED